MRKYDIALMLANRYGYTSYLEICTPHTGNTFTQVDKKQFSRRARLMYRRPAGYSDGEQVDFSTENESGEELYSAIVKSGEKFDLVFVDPFHTYTASLRDIVYGLTLTKSGGVVLIHDCLPPNAACTAPHPLPVEWCGLTFAAYLDVVLFAQELHYCTVDTDYGCGMISKDDRLGCLTDIHSNDELLSHWLLLELPKKYDFFEKHRSQLLRLITPDEFRSRLYGK